jgi:DNA modification methylase
MNRPPRNQVIVGDVRQVLPTLRSSSVDCVITSPPYFRLRDYQAGGQIGMEASVEAWATELRTVMREIARILRPGGGLLLNLGDTYSRHQRDGAPAKSLLLAPQRVALALIEDGWIIRNQLVWAKTNAMPTSARDRLASSHEVFFFAVREADYYFDLDAIRVPHRSKLNGPSVAAARRAQQARRPAWSGPLAGSNNGLDRLKAVGLVGHPLGKNPGDVWSFPTSNYRGAHHAMFPIDLVTRGLLAACPERVCQQCSRPWRRSPTKQLGHLAVAGELRPSCACSARWRSGLVLDPFMGAGTVAVAAEANSRDWLGIELNPEFAALTQQRLDARQTERRAKTDAADAA